MEIARIAALLEPFLNPGCPASSGLQDKEETVVPPVRARSPRPQGALFWRDGVAGGALSPAQLDQISTYIDLLLRWNARINLTAIRTPEEIVTRHFGESFFLARHLFPRPEDAASAPLGNLKPTGPNGVELSTRPQPERSAGVPTGSPEGAPPSPPALSPERSRLEDRSSKLTRVLDIGSGAGFPALPLKIWTPGIHLTLIESNHKKAAFLREAIRTLTLMDIDVIADRAETVLQHLVNHRHSDRRDESVDDCHSERSEESVFPRPFLADVVTFRAVEKFDKILPLAVRFLTPNGLLALLIGSAQLPILNTVKHLSWMTVGVPESQTRVLSIGCHRDG